MLQAIAVDPDPLALNVLLTFCQRLETITLCQSFTDADQARDYLRSHSIDLVFLEIDLPHESGLDFWQSVRQPGTDDSTTPPRPMVIFTTASRDHALASYDLQATDYLLKPLAFERFSQAVQKVATYAHWQQLATAPANLSLSLRIDSGLVRVNITAILWIKALSNYLKIYLDDKSFLIVRMTMKAMLQALPATDFVRVHRSYIVPIQRVKAVHNKLIRIEEKRIPLSSNYEPDFYTLVRTQQPSSPLLPPLSHTQLRPQQLYANARIAL